MLNKNIILVGFMGSGKTTIGKLLAAKLNMNFIDTDAEIEKQEGLLISEIFEKKGEGYFRQLESNFLQNCRYSDCVIATGGGMPSYGNNMILLKKIGHVIYINTPFYLLVKRLELSEMNRPLFSKSLKEENFLKDLFEKRESVYNLADYKVDGSLNKSEFILEVIKTLNK